MTNYEFPEDEALRKITKTNKKILKKSNRNKPDTLGHFRQLCRETIYPQYPELAFIANNLDEVIADLRNYCQNLQKYKAFYDHIQQHLDGTTLQVCCKICDKTYQQIITEWLLTLQKNAEEKRINAPCKKCHLHPAINGFKYCKGCLTNKREKSNVL